MQRKVVSILASSWCFYVTVGLLLLQASWIALTARYPQAFDEQFHFGVIQLYAHQWSPFFIHQPTNADRFGALTVDPSFLYHYLLSFPYRLLAHITSNQTVQVVSLRFINIGLFVSSLFVFRKLLAQTPASRALTHAILLFFVFIPVVPLLAAQINYDNLFIPLVGLSLLWMVQFVRQWQTEQVFPFERALWLLLLGIVGSTVKYAFLPVLAASAIIILATGWKAHQQLLPAWSKQLKALSVSKLAGYGLLIAVSLVFWLGVYGRNLVNYHALLPSCDRVLNVQRCMADAPWQRNYQFAHDGLAKPHVWSIVTYDWQWVDQSMRELLFTITSVFDSDGVTVVYYPENPLPLIQAVAWAVFISGAVLVIYYRQRLWQLTFFRISALVSLLYIVGLWAEDFKGYLYTGQPVAIHGRYLLPFLPLMLIAIGLCYSWLLHSSKLRARTYFPQRQAWLVVLALLLVLQGGGFITYIVRSDSTWFGGDDTKASKVNRAARKVLKPVIIGD